MPYPVPNLGSTKTPEECKQMVRTSLQAGHDRMCRIEASQEELKSALEENTAATLDTQSQMAEAVGILNAMKGGMKVLNWLGQGLKWAAMVAGAVYTFYCIAKGKNPFQ